MYKYIYIKTIKSSSLPRIILFMGLLILLNLSCKKNRSKHKHQEENYVQYVDPNIGTAHSRWFFYTPAAMPFGMAKLAPSTNGSYGNKSGWEAVGYDSRHQSIEGFSSLHEFQIGGFLFTGITGQLKTIPGALENPNEGYRSRFDKKDEVAEPGYYKVFLKDYQILVELTATKRTGWQRYTFPESDKAYLIFDIGNQLGESGAVKDAKITYNDDGSLEGYVITYPEYVKKYQSEGDIKMYFYAEVNKKPLAHGAFRKKEIFQNKDGIDGVGAGMYLKYKTSDAEQIIIKTGLSYTSIKNAKNNLASETKNLEFDAVRKKSREAWEKELRKIKVTDTSSVNKTKFYTALFHALLGRGLASDVNGQFPQNDGSIGQVKRNSEGKPKFNVYNTDAVWGTFWNLNQLWALVWPEYYNDFIQSHLEVYKNSGWLADGVANGRYVSGVGTNFVGLLIASGFQTGVLQDNLELAYEAALKNEIQFKNRKKGAGKMDLKRFIEEGFIPYIPGNESNWDNSPKGSPFSVSHSLEYAFSSYAVAQMAHKMDQKDDYIKLMALSQKWKYFYDKETGFFRPRLKDGTFLKKFDPLVSWVGFQEGNAMQYSYYVPHNPKALVELVGKEKFNFRLDSIFEVAEKSEFGGKGIEAFAGIETVYNHGNQPSLHIAWLFNFSEQPWLTQKWTRSIGSKFYGTEEIHGYGYGQDEDQGQLSAWYVMSALGIFDVRGLTEINPTFQFGSPIFDKVELMIDKRNGKYFSIETIHNGPSNFYIDKVWLNTKPYQGITIPFDEIRKGGTLKFQMSNKPNKEIVN